MEKLEKMKKGEPKFSDLSLLEFYLSTPEIDFKDIIGMSADMLLAGMDTVIFEIFL